MKMRILFTGLVMALCAGIGSAQTAVQPQPANAKWIGLWQAQLDGQQGVIVTLAERDGRLDGTVVFNIVRREPQPHVVASEPLMLRGASIDGDTLHFQVNAFQDRPALQYDVKSTGVGTAHLKCLNCDGTAEADLVRAPVYAKKD